MTSYYLHMQGDGWPLGLQPLNVRVGLVRNSDLNGSVSSNTLLTASTSAESYSTDLDTEVSAYMFDVRDLLIFYLYVVGLGGLHKATLHLLNREKKSE